jgi:uncharacterized membrane protein YgcG
MCQVKLKLCAGSRTHELICASHHKLGPGIPYKVSAIRHGDQTQALFMASCSPQSWTHDFRITAWSRITLALICLYVLLCCYCSFCCRCHCRCTYCRCRRCTASRRCCCCRSCRCDNRLHAIVTPHLNTFCTSTHSFYIDVAPRPATSVASCQLPRWPSDHRGPPPHACPRAPSKVVINRERESKSSSNSNSSSPSNSSSGGKSKSNSSSSSSSPSNSSSSSGGKSSGSAAAVVGVTAAAAAAAAAVATTTAPAVPGAATAVGGDQTAMTEVMTSAVQGQRQHQQGVTSTNSSNRGIGSDGGGDSVSTGGSAQQMIVCLAATFASSRCLGV